MTDYNDGKIHGWNGGECPVHPESEVMVWFRSGYNASIYKWAGDFIWRHYETVSDIIAFQVTKPYVETKTIWVNEYTNGDRIAFPSEDEAKGHRSSNATRIAVKYVEAKE